MSQLNDPTPTETELSDVVVLDCTLRDGGFYTAWDFPDALVHAYVRAMDAAGVTWAEMGYRSLKVDGFSGAWRFSTEASLEALPELETTGLAVMLDAKEFAGREALVERLFVPADRSRVGLVRVASAQANLDTAVELIRRLAGLGYKTTLNLMALATVPEDAQGGLLRQMIDSGTDVVYVADSYGSMLPEDIAGVAGRLREVAGTSMPTWGVHLHNNLECAFANALEGMRQGARWVDTSVTGMGRGPGNLKTELFLQHLETRRGLGERFRTEPVYGFIGRHMAALHEAHRWGPSPPYVLSGHLSVHPTFAQALLGSGRYSAHEVTDILQTVHASGRGAKFDAQALDQAVSARFGASADSAGEAAPLPAHDWSGRPVLVLGRGPALLEHRDAVQAWIRATDPVVLECNLSPFVERGQTGPHYCVFNVLANAQRLGKEALSQGKDLLLGVDPSDAGLAGLERVVCAPYEVAGGQLGTSGEAGGGEVVVPHDDVSMVAIAHAVKAGAKRIHVAGLDGYPPSGTEREQRQQAEMLEFVAVLRQVFPDVELVALTPSSYGLASRSVYGELFLREAGLEGEA